MRSAGKRVMPEPKSPDRPTPSSLCSLPSSFASSTNDSRDLSLLRQDCVFWYIRDTLEIDPVAVRLPEGGNPQTVTVKGCRGRNPASGDLAVDRQGVVAHEAD